MRSETHARSVAFAAAATLFACSQLAGLEDPTPKGADDTTGAADGGATTAEGVTIAPTEVRFGEVGCGVAAPERELSITNGGDAPVEVEAKVPESTPFYFKVAGAAAGPGAPGPRVVKQTVPPKGNVFVYVSAVTSTPETFSSEIVVQAGPSVVRVPVQTTIRGGILDVSPKLVDFGEVRRDTAVPPIQVNLKNSGNDRVVVTGYDGVGPEFTLPGGTVTIEPGQETAIAAALKAGPETGTLDYTVTPKTEKPTCNDVPTFTLKGRRVNQDVTVGPLAADFDDWFCTQTPNNPQTFTITNYNTSDPAAYEIVLQQNSWYGLSGTGPTGTVDVAVNASTPTKKTFSVVAKTLGGTLGTHTETVEVKITSPPASVASKLIPVRIDVRGAVLQVSPGNHTGFAPDQEKTFTVANVGNYPVIVGYSLNGNGFSVSGGDDYLDPAVPFIVGEAKVRFTAPDPGTYNANVVFNRKTNPLISSGILCAQPTATVSATR